jgi:hypothetical protein
MKRLACVLCLLTLTSCAEWQARMAAQREAQRQAILAQDDQTCRSYGVQAGTDAYVACRMNIANSRAQLEQVAEIADANRRAAALQASAILLSH